MEYVKNFTVKYLLTKVYVFFNQNIEYIELTNRIITNCSMYAALERATIDSHHVLWRTC